MTITIPGVPMSQPRQRHRVVEAHGKTFSQNYTPAKAPVNDYKATIRNLYTGPLLSGPLSVSIELFFPRPKALQWKTREWVRTWHTTKPDAENVAKAILDALTHLAWLDDKQVCQLTVMKFVCGREAPRTVVRIQEMQT